MQKIKELFLKLLMSAVTAIGEVLVQELLKPLEEIKAAQKEQGEEIKALRSEQTEQMKQLEKLSDRVEQLHKSDPIIEECDLASLDNQICTLIAKCREKGFTTADERRRCGRMHEAYTSRGGNHGEEHEYHNVFRQLPTAEEYVRRKERGTTDDRNAD